MRENLYTISLCKKLYPARRGLAKKLYPARGVPNLEMYFNAHSVCLPLQSEHLPGGAMANLGAQLDDHHAELFRQLDFTTHLPDNFPLLGSLQTSSLTQWYSTHPTTT